MKVWFRHVRELAVGPLGDPANYSTEKIKASHARLDAIHDTIEAAVACGQVETHALHGKEESFELQYNVSAATICNLDLQNGSPVILGYSLCSVSDQFSRRKGRAVSFGRAKAVLIRRIVDGACHPAWRSAMSEADRARILSTVDERVAEAQKALAEHERRKVK